MSQDAAVCVSAEVLTAPWRVALSWPVREEASSYKVERRPMQGAMDWELRHTISTDAGEASGWVDAGGDFDIGAVYEYRVRAVYAGGTYPFEDVLGLVAVSLDRGLVEQRGAVLLVLEQTHRQALADAWERLVRDLEGDGWQVKTLEVPREGSASAAWVKSQILDVQAEVPGGLAAIFLLGHVPVPYSGRLYPDGHPDHEGAWPADIYYGDMSGVWPDEQVNFPGTLYGAANVPGDGRFDPSVLPAGTASVVPVGRVDFAGLPAFAESEAALLQRYLDKAHAYRHGEWPTARRGLIGDNFQAAPVDGATASAWRVFPGLFGGLGAIDTVGPWEFMAALESQDYLFAMGAGPGSPPFTTLQGVASTADFVSQTPRAVFLMLFGSYVGDWNQPDNLMRAALASAGRGLVCVWGGRPHVYAHRMAVGEPVGTLVTLQAKTGSAYEAFPEDDSFATPFGARGIHAGLMGDPTLRLHIVPPPRALVATSAEGAVTLSWEAALDGAIVGYHVYRAEGNVWDRLTAEPLEALEWTETTVVPGTFYRYMVRAVRWEAVNGRYANLSQGVQAVILAVAAPEEDFVTWASAAVQDADRRGALDDADGDGLANSFEAVLGTDPQQATPEEGIARLPVARLAEGRAALEWVRPEVWPSDLRLRVEASGDLEHWETVASRLGHGNWTGPAAVSEVPEAEGIRVRVRDVVPVEPGQPRFLRLAAALE